MSVIFVACASDFQTAYVRIEENILVRSHISATYAEKRLALVQHWRFTYELTLGRSHTAAEFVSKHSLVCIVSKSICESIQGRNPTLAAFVASSLQDESIAPPMKRHTREISRIPVISVAKGSARLFTSQCTGVFTRGKNHMSVAFAKKGSQRVARC